MLTTADLVALPEDGIRYELIEGEILASDMLGLTHQDVLGNLLCVLHAHTDHTSIGETVFGPGVIFDEFNSVIPDLIFIGNERFAKLISESGHVTGAPELMIEIVSPGKENGRRDRVVKRQTYGRFGVLEYWVVDPESRSIEVYRLQDQSLELVATLTDGDQLTSSVLPGFTCGVSSIFRI